MAGHSTAKVQRPDPFDPNALGVGETINPIDQRNRAQFPVFEGVMSVADYADAFMTMGIAPTLGLGAAKAEPLTPCV